jgi:hypothetical protein
LDRLANFIFSPIFFLLAILLAIGVPLTCACKRYNSDQGIATEAALEWSKSLSDTIKVECVKWDSDLDGYVSCTVYRESGDPLYIECAGAWTLNEGCRGRGRQ